MTLTLLLDLDGTLITSKVEPFVAAYARSIGKFLEGTVEPSQLIKSLMGGTQHMVASQRPDRTFQETFAEYFYPALGKSEEELYETFEAYYRQAFPSLQSQTEIRPEAAKLVDGAFRRGFRVAIATNPFFPLTATQQRLEWAGLPVDQYPFALVPSYETFHFAKPNPAFFAEFLGQMGWPDGPVLMVGNDLEADISGAAAMGISTFWVHNGRTTSTNGVTPTASGKLSDLLPWLDSIDLETLQPDFSSPTAMLSILRATPASLDILTRNVPAYARISRPLPDEWSITEIFCHLRDVEGEVNLPRLLKITQEKNPFIPGVDSDPWAEQRRYINQDCSNALDSFTQNRLNVMAQLDRLKPDDWQLPARHAIFGPTQLRELVSIMAGHDRLHIQQVVKVLQSFSVS